MKRNNLLLLAAVAAVVLAVILIGRDPEPASSSLDQGLLYPQLEAAINQVDQVIISGPEAARVVLSRAGDAWLVEPPGGYPADLSRLRELMLALAQARLLEAKTSKPEHYARLGLQGLEPPDSPTRRVQLRRDGELMHDLLIGDRRQGESFVRREGEAQSWLVSERLEASANSVDWVAKSIIDLPPARIRSVAVSPTRADAYRIERAAADAAFVMPGKSDAAVLKQSAVDRLAGALAGLRLADVSRGGEAVPSADWTLRYETFDGLAVAVHLAKREDKYRVRFEIGLAEPTSTLAGETLTEDAKAAESAARKAEAEGLQAALAPWVFELSDYDGGSLALLKADLLENQAAQ